MKLSDIVSTDLNDWAPVLMALPVIGGVVYTIIVFFEVVGR